MVITPSFSLMNINVQVAWIEMAAHFPDGAVGHLLGDLPSVQLIAESLIQFPGYIIRQDDRYCPAAADVGDHHHEIALVNALHPR
jgi:hypothetical protein